MNRLEKIIKNYALKLYRGFILEKDIDPAKINLSEIKTILLVIRHMMGDMLCSLPMINSLRQAFPGAKIILITKESSRFEEIFHGCKMPVDEVQYYEHGMENYFNIVKYLREFKIDLAVVPSTVVFSGTNHFIAYYSRAKITAGVRSMDFVKNPVWYLLNVKNDFDWGVRKTHQIERNLDIIRQLNIQPLVTKVDIPLSEAGINYAEKFYSDNFPEPRKKVIGFHPGARKETNIWPAEKFAELAFRLKNDFDAEVLISEGPSDRKYTEDMTRILAEKFGVSGCVIHKGSLAENAAVINMLSLFITNDTGIMHIASGLKPPLVALFGETYAFEWGPLGENKFAVQSQDWNIKSINIDSVYSICKDIFNTLLD